MLSDKLKGATVGAFVGLMAGTVWRSFIGPKKKIGLLPLAASVILGYNITTSFEDGCINHVNEKDKRAMILDSVKTERRFRLDSLSYERQFLKDTLMIHSGTDINLAEKRVNQDTLDKKLSDDYSAKSMVRSEKIISSHSNNNANTISNSTRIGSWWSTWRYELQLYNSDHEADLYGFQSDGEVELIAHSNYYFTSQDGPDTGRYKMVGVQRCVDYLTPEMSRIRYKDKNHIIPEKINTAVSNKSRYKIYIGGMKNDTQVQIYDLDIEDEMMQRIIQIYSWHGSNRQKSIFISIND